MAIMSVSLKKCPTHTLGAEKRMAGLMHAVDVGQNYRSLVLPHSHFPALTPQ